MTRVSEVKDYKKVTAASVERRGKAWASMSALNYDEIIILNGRNPTPALDADVNAKHSHDLLVHFFF